MSPWNNYKRDKMYALCLENLKRMLATRPNWDVIVVENTLAEGARFSRTRFGQSAATLPRVLVTENTGRLNKGVGELDMLHQVSRLHPFESYDSVSYFSGRRLMTCPYVLERTENAAGTVVLGNPDFLGLDGQILHSEKDGMFADMFFSMPPDAIQKYIAFFSAKRQSAISRGTGSEQLLYEFITSHGLEYDWLDCYGFVRFEPPGVFRKGRWQIL